MAKFKLGGLTEDDFDQDFVPGRSEKTTSAASKKWADDFIERTRAAARRIKKDDQIVIVLERE